MSNYVHRKKELEDLCLYDALSLYSVKKRCNEEMRNEVHDSHLNSRSNNVSQKYVTLVKKKKENISFLIFHIILLLIPKIWREQYCILQFRELQQGGEKCNGAICQNSKCFVHTIQKD